MVLQQKHRKCFCSRTSCHRQTNTIDAFIYKIGRGVTKLRDSVSPLLNNTNEVIIGHYRWCKELREVSQLAWRASYIYQYQVFILLPLPLRDREYGTMHVVSNLVPRFEKCSPDFIWYHILRMVQRLLNHVDFIWSHILIYVHWVLLFPVSESCGIPQNMVWPVTFAQLNEFS